MRHSTKPLDRAAVQQLTALVKTPQLLNRNWPCSAKILPTVGREIEANRR